MLPISRRGAGSLPVLLVTGGCSRGPIAKTRSDSFMRSPSLENRRPIDQVSGVHAAHGRSPRCLTTIDLDFRDEFSGRVYDRGDPNPAEADLSYRGIRHRQDRGPAGGAIPSPNSGASAGSCSRRRSRPTTGTSSFIFPSARGEMIGTIPSVVHRVPCGR